jgi:hypothetical protein
MRSQNMPASNTCRWCKIRIGIGRHSLCKSWYLFRIKEYISKLEDYTMLLENLVDELETEPA